MLSHHDIHKSHFAGEGSISYIAKGLSSSFLVLGPETGSRVQNRAKPFKTKLIKS